MTFWLVFWWGTTDDTPYVTKLDGEVEAESFARIRNGLVVEVTGKVGKMLDYYRRDPAGNPMPVQKVKPGQTARRFPSV